MEKSQSVFEKLSSINVNDKIEKKSGLTYLSWAFAWSEVKRACPDARYDIKETEYADGLGFMCHTTVTIEGETLEMWLPVMDGANKSMLKVPYSYKTKYGDKQVESATTFDINKTIMRCLVKNLAMFGLGLYIFAGEDLPEDTSSVVPKPLAKAEATLIDLVKDSADWANVVKYAVANKAQGIEKIGQQLNRKYSITPELKKELIKLINQ